jgi:hypothetical protein
MPVMIALLIAGLILFAGSTVFSAGQNVGEMNIEKADVEKSMAERPYSPWARRG